MSILPHPEVINIGRWPPPPSGSLYTSQSYAIIRCGAELHGMLPAMSWTFGRPQQSPIFQEFQKVLGKFFEWFVATGGLLFGSLFEAEAVAKDMQNKSPWVLGRVQGFPIVYLPLGAFSVTPPWKRIGESMAMLQYHTIWAWPSLGD